MKKQQLILQAHTSLIAPLCHLVCEYAPPEPPPPNHIKAKCILLIGFLIMIIGIYSITQAKEIRMDIQKTVRWSHLGKICANPGTIYKNNAGYAILQEDGTLITLGRHTLSHQPQQVQSVHASRWSFAAWLDTGEVLTWGYLDKLERPLKHVQTLTHNLNSFLAIQADGTVVVWGSFFEGGYMSAWQQQFLNNNIVSVTAVPKGFVAVLKNKYVFAWGRDTSSGHIPDHDISPICSEAQVHWFWEKAGIAGFISSFLIVAASTEWLLNH